MKFLKSRRRDLSKAITDLEQTVRPKRKKTSRRKSSSKK